MSSKRLRAAAKAEPRALLSRSRTSWSALDHASIGLAMWSKSGSSYGLAETRKLRPTLLPAPVPKATAATRDLHFASADDVQATQATP